MDRDDTKSYVQISNEGIYFCLETLRNSYVRKDTKL